MKKFTNTLTTTILLFHYIFYQISHHLHIASIFSLLLTRLGKFLLQDDKQHNLILEVIKNDSLRQLDRQKRAEAERCIKSAAKLISPVIDDSSNFAQGYDW